MKASIEFTINTLTILDHTAVYLIPTGRGHLQLPAGGIDNGREIANPPNKMVYSANTDPGTDSISYEELGKIHLHLGHCSEFTLKNMLQAAKINVPQQMITRMLTQCSCAGQVTRVTPPKISSWIAKFNGEIV